MRHITYFLITVEHPLSCFIFICVTATFSTIFFDINIDKTWYVVTVGYISVFHHISPSRKENWLTGNQRKLVVTWLTNPNQVIL